MVVMDHVGQLFKAASCLCNTEGLIAGCGAGSVVEEGLQWDVKVNSNDDIRAQRVNKSLAAMLTLRSACHVNTNPKVCLLLLYHVRSYCHQHQDSVTRAVETGC